LEANIRATEQASHTMAHYFSELVKQLNVIQPDACEFNLDGKTKWPAMKLVDFRYDHRKKNVNNRDLTDFVVLAWTIGPKLPSHARGKVLVNFPPDLAKVEARLQTAQIRFDKHEQRSPETHKLQAVVFEHEFSAKASVMWTAKHDKAQFQVRLSCVSSLEIQQLTIAARDITPAKLDELARLIVGQPSAFI
jgi:hypothetical protein